VGIAHGGADVLVAKELLDSPQILSHMVEDRGRGMAQSLRGNLQAGVEAAGAPKDLSLAATHADLYDKPESVGPTVAKLKDFYSEYLA
jgi:hypothetical protein